MLCAFMHFQLSTMREAGLHERAVRLGAALPCHITTISLPMTKSWEDPTIEMVDWPFLLPYDMAPWSVSILMF